MQDRWIKLIDSMGIFVSSLQLALRQYLHNAPKILNIILALLFGYVVCYNNKPIIFQILSPSLFFSKGYSIIFGLILIQIHVFHRNYSLKFVKKRIYFNMIFNRIIKLINMLLQNIYIQYYNIISMKIRKISQRFLEMQQIADFQHKQIQKFSNIFKLKRRVELEYKNNLQLVKKQMQTYLSQDNGFLTQVIDCYKSYISSCCHNQGSLVKGYDQIISIFQILKQKQIQQQIMKKAEFVDKKFNQISEQIKTYKYLLEGNWQKIQSILKKTNSKSPNDLIQQQSIGQLEKARLTDLLQARKYMQFKLEQEVDSLMQFSVQHHSAVEHVKQYQSFYLKDKADKVYDNFMRAFVIQVSFSKSLQHDLQVILKELDKIQNQNKIQVRSFKNNYEQQNGLRNSIISTYIKLTSPKVEFNLKGPYISVNIRQKWQKVCQYYDCFKV